MIPEWKPTTSDRYVHDASDSLRSTALDRTRAQTENLVRLAAPAETEENQAEYDGPKRD